MRSNAVKKQEYIQEVAKSPALAIVQESWEAKRLRLAKEIELACSLADHVNGADLGAFEEKYLRGGASFA